MFCMSCGQEMPDVAIFCQRCGKPLKAGNQSQPSVPRWEECVIVWHQTHKSKLTFTRSRFKFIAQVTGPDGVRNILESPELSGDPTETYNSKKDEARISEVITSFHMQLLAQGWESVEHRTIYRWYKKYRRQVV